ncbi:CPCC family cysteine-rich protein [Paenibacillus mucilaginosus]|uniref:CPCC family cysteine-rich protein n=1 Tax=Paenibacillus mucilaginosus TaxID=61624 RepID=UPI0009DAF98E|nr:CPCC family cysteine-rich protein [Paenibacillus mucilaginosus]MCG7216462.1 hypothetical protein [Paenibacillus mucilaginosus]WDM31002.1 hypothetical protein KCX80_18430 [Paenibacillus mucilaginosus]
MKGKYYCPCCGYKTLDYEPPGSHDICEICFWEDDMVQFNDPDYDGGANAESLRQYQRQFILGRVNREPKKSDERNPHWKPLC